MKPPSARTTHAYGGGESNILVKCANETKYFYQDLDANGARLNSANRYTVTFDGAASAGEGFWSLSIYNEHHFFHQERPEPILGRHQEQGSQVRPDGR